MRTKILCTLLLLILICSFGSVFPMRASALVSDQKWFQIAYQGSNYSVHVKSNSAMSNIYRRPLIAGTDSTQIIRLYATDAYGNIVTDQNLINQLVIDAQNDARLVTSLQSIDFKSTIQLNLQLDTRADSQTGLTYNIYVPSALPDWWKEFFLYHNLLNPLDAYSNRAEMYSNVLLELTLQTALNDMLSNDQSLRNELVTVLHGSDATFDWSVKILQGEQNFVVHKDEVNSLLDWINSGSHDLNAKVITQLDRLSSAIGMVTTVYDITAEALRFYMLGALANARAQERLDQLASFVATNSGPIDAAISEGMSRAETKFQTILDTYYDNVRNALSSAYQALAGNAVDLVYATVSLAGAFAGGALATIAAVAVPYYLSYQVVKMLNDSIDDMMSACLAATIQSMLTEQFSSVYGLPSYRTQIANAVPG
jgi:hypothetical protein